MPCEVEENGALACQENPSIRKGRTLWFEDIRKLSETCRN